jgi:WhiB family redox-sensing transcriptional regulator
VKTFTFTKSHQESFRGDNTVLTVTDWRELSDCRDSDPDLFFPIGTTGLATDKIRQSVAICSACAMQEECLQYALETNQEAGVWGGYAEDDRRRLRKRWLAERRRQRQAAS